MLRNRIIVGVALAAMLGSGIAATVSDSQARESVEGPVTAQIVRTVPLEDVAKLDKPKPVAVSKVEAPATPAAPVTAPVVTPPVSVVSAPVSVPVAPAVVSAKLTPAAPVVSAVAPPVVESAKPVAPVCEEDQPCFDCRTMGNRICGPTAVAQIEAACKAKGMLTAEDLTCVPSSFGAPVKSAGQGGAMGNAGKGAPVGPPPAGVGVSPVYGNPPYTEGNCPPGIKNMSEAGCPATAPVDTCEEDLNDLLSADSSVTADSVVGMVWDGKHCTISTK